MEHFTRTHFTLGRIFGIPVGLNASWFAIFAIVVWTLATGYFPQVAPMTPIWTMRAVAVFAALAFFASILAHEFGHALVAQASGIEVRGVTLFVLGGVSRIASEPRNAREELFIAAAGPLASLGLAVAGYAAAVFLPKTALITALLAYLVLVNLALAAFNLIPALPLDGGRILRAAIWRVSGSAHRATRYCAWAGRSCGVAMAGVGIAAGLLGGWLLGFWLIVIGIFIERSAYASSVAALAADLERMNSLQQVVAVLHSTTNASSGHPLPGIRGMAAGPGDRLGRETPMNVEARYHALMEQVIEWRSRLDVLPRPGELTSDDPDVPPDEGRAYQEARMEMYDILNRIDVEVRSRLDEAEIDRGFGRLSSLYQEWKQPELASADLTDDPGDSIAAGRPERFAPTPEEVLTREPGSSLEV